MSRYVASRGNIYVGRQAESAASTPPGATTGRDDKHRRYVTRRNGVRVLAGGLTAAVATATTLNGPGSGTTGVASTLFTVGLNGPPVGTVIVTPSDGGAGGSFTPVTVALSTGTPTATFTYTPASPGVKTLTLTNNASLSNPPLWAYTSNAVGATTLTLSGPSNGTVGVASTPFTVGANGGVTGSFTVTPTDGAGGVFSPAFVTLTAAQPTALFTYTPGSVGTKSIRLTNAGGLLNGAAFSYISTALGALTSYPALPQGRASGEIVVLGREGDRATNGAIHMRSFYSSEPRTFKIVHEKLTQAERDQLEAFYATNKFRSFSFTFDGGVGATYTCIFGKFDFEWKPVSFQCWTCNVMLESV
jgi:hypothetical protein